MNISRYIPHFFLCLVTWSLNACDDWSSVDPRFEKLEYQLNHFNFDDMGDVMGEYEWLYQPVWIGIRITGVQDTVFHADSTCSVLAQFPQYVRYDEYMEYLRYWHRKYGYHQEVPECTKCSAEFSTRNGG